MSPTQSANGMDLRPNRHELPGPAPDFPHSISCIGCRAEHRCCQCGSARDRARHCVNGRCPKCCDSDCDHDGHRYHRQHAGTGGRA